MANPVNHGDPVDGEPVPTTRPPRTLTEWLDSPDGVPVNATANAPVTGAAMVMRPDTAMLLRDTAEVLEDLAGRLGAPPDLITRWTTELNMAARRLDDAEDDRRAEIARRSTVWVRRRAAAAAAVATLIADPARRLHHWARTNAGPDEDWG